MTPEEFEQRMIGIYLDSDQGERDTERTHRAADELMTEVLFRLGYEKGVQVFLGACRWYS